MEREGVAFETQVVSAGVEEAPEAVAGLLGLRAERSAFRLRRLRRIDGVPVAYLDNWVRLDLCPGLRAQGFPEREAAVRRPRGAVRAPGMSP
ncbi:MAG: UTRA domain-containing protein [Hymenobacter sp.]